MMAGAGLRPAAADAIRRNCQDAAAAIAEFAGWFDAAIMPRPDGAWRLGSELYELKYRYQMDYPLGPAALLTAAEASLDGHYAELVELARRIHDGYLADAISAGSLRPEAELEDAQVARNVFERMSDDHPTTDTLIEDSYAMADAIVGFVEDNNLIDLPPTAKLRIEDIPSHLSGDAVARIQTAPPFDEPEFVTQDPLVREQAISMTVQLVAGERCALAASSGLINCAPDEASKRFLATQTLDEARHVEIFTQRLFDLGVKKSELET